MTSVLITGILAAFVATTLAAAAQRAPTRTHCPTCRGKTVAIHPEAWLLKRMPDVRLRWCQACSWEGWGRHGAEWIPGHPAAHDSGFFWGADEVPEDFGFRFADRRPAETSAEPPHHPSGFRFSRPPAPSPEAHPSGFSWADNGKSGTEGEVEPAGFRWAPPPAAGGPLFAWRRRRGRPGPPPVQGFFWKDAG